MLLASKNNPIRHIRNCIRFGTKFTLNHPDRSGLQHWQTGSGYETQQHFTRNHSSMLKVPFTGRALLDSPNYNKGTAFTDSERRTFELEGLLPRSVQTLQDQHDRAYEQYRKCPDNLSKNVFMYSMIEQNVVLFYRLLLSHLEEMLPVVYTPTEGDAIVNYSHIFRSPSGCFLDIDQQDDMEGRMRRAAEGKHVRYIVVSDGEAILGLGDQGVGGILISVAKLMLATACGGVSPFETLPVVLDVGTDKKGSEQGSFYLGTKQSRTRGEEYDDFVNKFVGTARKVFPDAYIHFEVRQLHRRKPS